MAAVVKMAGAVVGEHDMLLMFVADDPRLRIRQFAAARQFQEQECAGTFEADAIAANDTTALTHCGPSRAVDIMPKRLIAGCAARHSVLNVSTSGSVNLVRLKFPPGAEAAHVAEREIACLADAPLRRSFRVGAGRDAEDLARGLTVDFIARIARGVIVAIRIKLPLFAGDPGPTGREHCDGMAGRIVTSVEFWR